MTLDPASYDPGVATRARHLGWWLAAAALTLGCAGQGVGDGDSSPLPSPSATTIVAEPVTPPPQAGGDLSAEQQRIGDALAARIRPKLAALRTAGDLAPESTRQALLDLGLAADAVEVTPMRARAGETTPPGAVYAVRFAEVGCVAGDVRPSRLLVSVTRADPEYGCLEPFTH